MIFESSEDKTVPECKLPIFMYKGGDIDHDKTFLLCYYF